MGLQHILEHHGTNVFDVYRRIFQVLWFDNKIGPSGTDPEKVPTYVYPDDVCAVVRIRFPHSGAGKRDDSFSEHDEGVVVVTWQHIRTAKWPKPPKSCRLCA